ncbi:hypothetical protein NL108_004464, partial [Boleophthalmus pectinirostris]
MRHILLSRTDITALCENIRVSARFFGWDILTNMQPTIMAFTMDPKMACTKSKMIPSGHFSVITRYPYPMVVSVSMENKKAETKL